MPRQALLSTWARGVLHHFRGPGGAFFYAQAAHFATGGGLYGVTVYFDGAEGTQRRKGGLVRDKLGMENQLCHFSALPATAFVPSAGRTAARQLRPVPVHFSCLWLLSGGKMRCTWVGEPLSP